MSETWAQVTEISLSGGVHWLKPLTRRWLGGRWRPRFGLWVWRAFLLGLVPPCSCCQKAAPLRFQREESILRAPARLARALLDLPGGQGRGCAWGFRTAWAWAWARSRVNATWAHAESRGWPSPPGRRRKASEQAGNVLLKTAQKPRGLLKLRRA